MAVGKFGECVTVRAKVDVSHLNSREKNCLRHLIRAAEAIRPIYWKQLSEHGLPVYNFIKQVARHAPPGKRQLFKDYRYYLELNHGFFDKVNSHKKFVPEFSRKDVEKAIANAPQKQRFALEKQFSELREHIFSQKMHAVKPAGGTIYGLGVSKAQVEEILESGKPEHAGLAKELQKPNTLVKSGNGEIYSVPYEQEYSKHLEIASGELCKAAEHASGPLKTYLLSRANALIGGVFWKSDAHWLKTSGNVNIIIGPIETYVDELMGLKAAYGSQVYVRDHALTAKLEKFKKVAQRLEDTLPCQQDYKNRSVKVPPIEAVQVVSTTGDHGGIRKAIASVLPNDDEFRQTVGHRITYFANIHEAKRQGDGKMREILDGGIYKLSKEELHTGSLLEIVLHEMGHSSGRISPRRGTNLDKILREHASVFGETKAYVLSLRHASQLARDEAITGKERDAAYYAFLIDVLKKMHSAGKSLVNAHERAMTSTFNYLFEKGGIALSKGRFSLDIPKAETAIEELSAKILEMQGEGSREKTAGFFNQYARLRPDVANVLKKLKLPRATIVKLPQLRL